MLALTRRIGEEIVIDGNIHVTVVEVQGGKIRLGITAPPSVRVLRSELLARDSPQGERGNNVENKRTRAAILAPLREAGVERQFGLTLKSRQTNEK